MDNKEKNHLKRLINVCKKNTKNIILVLCVFILCGCFYSYNIVIPKYKSTSSIVLTSDNTNQKENSVTQSDLTLNKTLISTYGKIIKSSKVLNKVIENLNLDMTEEELFKNINIEEIRDTQIIQIEVINAETLKAQKIAKELNSVFIEEIKEIYKVDNINIIDDALVDNNPYNINHILDIVIFFAIGVICSVSMISIIYIFDTTVKIKQDIEEYIGLKVIGVVPKYKQKNEDELIVQNDGKSIISETFKTIRTNLSFSKAGKQSKAFLFTSCNESEGKSWITSNIAVAFALSNKNVILVDADMRKGRQHNIFKVQNKNGLSECLENIRNREDFEELEKYIQETSIPRVHIMTIGAIPSNPSELLSSNKLNDLIYMLKCAYDIVIIDGTPCNLVSDSISVSRIADSTILVTESRRTKIEDIENIVNQIQNVGGNIENAILNKKDVKGKEYKKRYYYGDLPAVSNIPQKTYTVRELIENRRDYIEEKVEIIEQPLLNQNNEISLLSEKIKDLEEIILQIPNQNIESYKKIIESVEKSHNNEIDKIKLLESVKENIIKNEVEKSNIETRNELNELLKTIKEKTYDNQFNELVSQIDEMKILVSQKDSTYENIKELTSKLEQIEETMNQNKSEEEIKNLVNKINQIEIALNTNETEENIVEMINKLKEHQDENLENMKKSQDKKIESLNYNKEIEELVCKLNQIEIAINKKETEENIKTMINELTQVQNKKIEELNVNDLLIEIQNKIENVNVNQDNNFEKFNETNGAIASIIEMINKLQEHQDEKLEKIKKSQNEKLRAIQKGQNAQIENLNYDKELAELIGKLNQIELEMSKNESKDEIRQIINKINQIERTVNQNVVNQNETEENIKAMIDKFTQNQNRKIDELQFKQDEKLEKIKNSQNAKLREIKKNQNEKIESLNYEKQLESLVQKMSKLEESIGLLTQNNTNIKKSEVTNKNTKQVTSKLKNNVIELKKIKEKLNNEELVIKVGQDISYEQLLDYAIEIYDIEPETYNLRRRIK